MSLVNHNLCSHSQLQFRQADPPCHTRLHACSGSARPPVQTEATVNAGRSRCAAGSSPAPASIRYLPGTCALDCTTTTAHTDAAGALRHLRHVDVIKGMMLT